MATTTPPRAFEIVPIEEEMKRSYLDYAMSVIVSRALPDVRDGLKPVQRRILYAMREGGYDFGKPHRKSARIVGDVMGKYHPHGDSAIYDAMVRMAQDFGMRLPLIDGQGNFGSMDGDPPAAMRYTEARLAKAADALLADIDKDTVDFRPNYDESCRGARRSCRRSTRTCWSTAPAASPSAWRPTSRRTIWARSSTPRVALIDEPDLELADLAAIVQGPDFPTGGIILGRNGILQAYRDGRGSIIIRSKTHFEEVRGRTAIIVAEVPYQVNKARMVERIAEVVREKKVEGIADLRDESDRHGVRVVIEVKREADPDVVLNQLFKFTPLQTSFGINMVSLRGGRPELLGLQGDARGVPRLPRGGDPPPHGVRPRQGARAGAHRRGPRRRGRQHRRGHRPDPRARADPQAAKAALMARAWPLADILPLMRLVQVEEGEGESQVDARPATGCRTSRPRPSSSCACSG